MRKGTVQLIFVGGGHQEEVTTCELDWGMEGFSPTPLSLKCTFCPLAPQQELFQECKVLLRPSGWYKRLNPVL